MLLDLLSPCTCCRRSCAEQERAIRILEQWLPHTVSRFKLREILNRAYSSFEHEAVAPIVPVNTPSHLSSGRRLFLQELFWGPTASFKDLALQVMPQILELLAEGAYVF